MHNITTLTLKSVDIFVNSYYLNPIFFVMTAVLEEYEYRFLSGYHCSAAPSIKEIQLFSSRAETANQNPVSIIDALELVIFHRAQP